MISTEVMLLRVIGLNICLVSKITFEVTLWGFEQTAKLFCRNPTLEKLANSSGYLWKRVLAWVSISTSQNPEGNKQLSKCNAETISLD